MPHFTELIDQLPISQFLVIRALDVVVKNQGDGTEEERRTDWLPLFYLPRPGDGAAQPVLSFAGEDSDATLAAVPRDRWERLAQRADAARHPFLSALYFDLLWRERRRHGLPEAHVFGRAAVSRYELAVRERFGDLDLFWDALNACKHIARIGRQLNAPAAGLSAAKLVGELLDSVRAHWSSAPGFPLSAAEALVDDIVAPIPKARRGPEMLAEVRAMLGRLEVFLAADARLIDSPVGRDALDGLAALEGILGIDRRREREMQQAESHVADARIRGQAGDCLAAGSIMNSAAEGFTALGEAEKAAAAKREARDFFRRGQAEMVSMGATVSIPAARIELLVESMATLGPLRLALWAAVNSGEIIPDWGFTVELSRRQSEKSVLQAIMPAVQIVDGRQVSAEPSGEKEVMRRNWQMGIRLGVHMVWNPLVERLKLKDMTAEALVGELASVGVVANHNRRALARAVEAALSDDHVVACHLLPPVVESAIRHVCDAAGLDMTAFRPKDGGQYQERTMGALFDDDPSSDLARAATKFFGDDLWNWYRATLFDEKGLNLRNRSAHGLLRDDECTPENSGTLLLALVALLRLKDPPPEATAVSVDES